MAAKRRVVKAGTEVARQAFLYQGVTSAKELCEVGGISPSTLSKHITRWKKEREEILSKSSGLGVNSSLSVSDEVLEAHKADLAFIRQRVDEIKTENEQLGPIIANLENLIDQISSKIDDSGQTDKLLSLFDKYLRLSMNKKSLDKHFLDLKNAWDAKSGVDSLKSVQEATAKAVSVASAKAAPTEDGPEAPRVVSGDVFRKRL